MARKSKAPEDWYSFSWGCELHGCLSDNLPMMGQHRETCKRKPKRKVQNPDNLRCHWSCCPKLEEKNEK